MLKAFFEENPAAAIAFSGGVDSAYLLYEASKHAKNAAVYFVKTEFQPEFELSDARRLAEELSVRLEVINLSVLADEEIRANPPRRCYFCKKQVFSNIQERARQDGFSLILDGSNTDDDPAQRPGMKALEEMKVRSPLREAGLSKADIRRLSREAGLFTWNKPSYSCLATRVPTGCELQKDILEKIERGEGALMALGFDNFRLRWRSGAAKLELTAEQMPMALEKREEIIAAIGGDFTEISLDLKSRG